MFCSNCGAEAEGNFCKNCGAPLPKEEPSTEKSNESIDAEYKVYDEEEDQKQKDKQKNVKVTKRRLIKKHNNDKEKAPFRFK